MRLCASLAYDGRYDELLAIVIPKADEFELLAPNYRRRRVAAIIKQRGVIWKRYFGFWASSAVQRLGEDRHSYVMVRFLSVDGEPCPFALVSVERNVIRLIICVPLPFALSWS